MFGITKKYGKPEIIIYGLKGYLRHYLVNEYKDKIKEGLTIEPGKFYDDFLEGFPVTFIEVDVKHYDEHFGWAQWLYNGNSFQVLQMIWPTTNGNWPWDQELSEYYQWAQPILNEKGEIENIVIKSS